MKLSRPALAAVAAVAVAAGSAVFINTAHPEPAAHPAPNQAAAPALIEPLDDASPQAPVANPAAADAPVDPPAAEVSANPVEGTGLDANPADAATVDGFVGAVADEQVPPEIEVAAGETPNHGDQPAAAVSLRPMSLKEAPKTPTSKPAIQDWVFHAFEYDSVKKEDGKIHWIPRGGESGNGVPNGKVEAYMVNSPSMGREIPVAVIPAKDAEGNKLPGAPTLYLLNGAGGAEQDADWLSQGGALEAFEDKGVNVVIPMEGAFSYYVDWLEDGEVLKEKSRYFKGAQKWTTFLGRELQPAIEQELGANGKRGVIGMSMSATSSLLLAEHYPGEYQAVGSFSGCAATSTPLPWAFSALTINRSANTPTYTSLTPAHAWGPMGSPYNRYNDALVNADKLEGTALYISNASGLAAETDMLGYRMANGQSSAAALNGSATTTVEGGVIEAATNSCTHDLRAKLNGLGINAHYEFRNAGTHTWAVWRDDLKQSWNKVIGPALVGSDFKQIEGLEDPVSWGSANSSSSN